MTAYTILKEYIWLMNIIHHAGIRTPGQSHVILIVSKKRLPKQEFGL